MKSNKKEYHLQAKRKAYQEFNNPGQINGSVATAEAQPEVTVDKVTEVEVKNKAKTPKVNKVEVVSTEVAEPETVGASAT